MKKHILKVLIASLCISAIIGIIIILTGELGKIEAKILFTTLAIFAFSIPCLCCSTIYNKNKILSTSGITTCIITGILLLLLIWIRPIRQTDIFWKIFVSLSLISGSLSHISLLLLVDSNKIVKIVRNCTITLSATIVLIIVLALLANIEFISFRFLLVLLILTALGTILCPILNKVYDKKNS